MLFAFEQITIASTTTKLTEDTYTISNQHADYALFTLDGGNITVRYDGTSPTGGTLLTASNEVLKLDNREMIEGFRAESASGTPVINIQYIMLEWTDLRRLFVPKVKIAPRRIAKSLTHNVDMNTGATQRRRILSRPLHQFELETFGMRGMKDEEDMHGFFHYHQGDRAFFLHANKYSVVEYPKIVGYGDDSIESFFLPAKFIIPNTLKVFFDGMEVDSYSLNHASGLLTFYTAPPNKVIVSATYSHYYKVIFIDDEFTDELIEQDNNLLNRTFKVEEVTP